MKTVFLIICAILPFIFECAVQYNMQSKYMKWSQVPSKSGVTGSEAVKDIIVQAGIDFMRVGHCKENISCYSPKARGVALSEENYHGTSLNALAISAQKAALAIQYEEDYAPAQLYVVLLPFRLILSLSLIITIFGGIFMHSIRSFNLSGWICLFFAISYLAEIFMSIDASRRAEEALLQLSIIDNEERVAVREVLNAVALTSVSGLVNSLSWLILAFSTVKLRSFFGIALR